MEKSSFFNSVSHDRTYKAEDWAEYFASFNECPLLLLKCLTNSAQSANGSALITMQLPKISVICWTALPCTNIN